MAAYYNELDPYAAQWLRNLIAAKRGALNPALSLWLMGYPKPWMDLAPSRESVRSKAPATPSSRKSRRRS